MIVWWFNGPNDAAHAAAKLVPQFAQKQQQPAAQQQHHHATLGSSSHQKIHVLTVSGVILGTAYVGASKVRKWPIFCKKMNRRIPFRHFWPTKRVSLCPPDNDGSIEH